MPIIGSGGLMNPTNFIQYRTYAVQNADRHAGACSTERNLSTAYVLSVISSGGRLEGLSPLSDHVFKVDQPAANELTRCQMTRSRTIRRPGLPWPSMRTILR